MKTPKTFSKDEEEIIYLPCSFRSGNDSQRKSVLGQRTLAAVSHHQTGTSSGKRKFLVPNVFTHHHPTPKRPHPLARPPNLMSNPFTSIFLASHRYPTLCSHPTALPVVLLNQSCMTIHVTNWHGGKNQ